jgi:hypothetical protein
VAVAAGQTLLAMITGGGKSVEMRPNPIAGDKRQFPQLSNPVPRLLAIPPKLKAAPH